MDVLLLRCLHFFVVHALVYYSSASILTAHAPRCHNDLVTHVIQQVDASSSSFRAKGFSALMRQTPRGGAAVTPGSITKQREQNVSHLPPMQVKESSVVERQPIAKDPLKTFPITKSEFPHFAAMSFMMFLFIYVFTTVRDTKDTLVVSNCGAEAIPFLKLYGVMPCAMLFLLGYSKLSNLFSSKSVLFYVTLLPFFTFYTAFAFILYPNRDLIHNLLPTATSNESAPISLLRYWSFSLYFIVSELWASAGVPLLFWTCANDVTKMDEARRFYPLFAVVGNLAPIVSGKVMSAIVAAQQSSDDVSFGQTLKCLALIKVAACLGICVLYRLVNNNVTCRDELDCKNAHSSEPTAKRKVNKKKPTLRESIVELSKSSELRSLATMVVCYNACIELTEVLWKAILRKQFTNKSDYMNFMGKFSQAVGFSAFFLQMFASNIILRFGWKNSALIPPLSMAITAVLFYASVAKGGATLATALLIGTIQNVISKITKYSLFDPCKEMAYIPLGPEAKVKGKAAVDVLGARLGRSIGSAAQQLLVLAAGGTILRCAPALGVLYMAAVLFWCNSVFDLSRIVEIGSQS